MASIRSVVLTSALAALCAAWTPSNASEPKPVRPFYNHFTDADELKIGAASAQKIESEGVSVPGAGGQSAMAHVKRNVVLEGYLESIASKLGQASQRPDMVYTVRVIDAPDIVNAMSTPGGHIYIYSGLLIFVQTEGELASVLAHEIGHVVARHAINQIARIEMVTSLIDQARESNVIKDDQTAQKIADVAVPILFSMDSRTFYSRDQENEADLLGFYEMERAGWDPKSEAQLLARFAKISPKESMPVAFIATHPDVSQRLAIVQKEYAGAKVPSGLKENSLQFQAMKVGLSIAQ